MQKLPFRTYETDLADGDVVLLDVCFHGLMRSQTWIPVSCLGRGPFSFWNLDYSHDFDQQQLNHHLETLCQRGLLESSVQYGDKNCVRMTPQGGEVWSRERCPDWKRFCRIATLGQGTCCNDQTWRHRVIIFARSAKILDDALRLWPAGSTRQSTGIHEDHGGILYWRTFPKLYVGVSDFDPKFQFDPEHLEAVERERTWWGTVSELLRFVPPNP